MGVVDFGIPEKFQNKDEIQDGQEGRKIT